MATSDLAIIIRGPKEKTVARNQINQ